MLQKAREQNAIGVVWRVKHIVLRRMHRSKGNPELAYRHASPKQSLLKAEHAEAPRAGVLAWYFTARHSCERSHCSIYLAGDVAASRNST